MALRRWQRIVLEPYNRVVETLISGDLPTTDWMEIKEVEEKAKVRTDIASHLRTIFLETVENRPNLIVELGVKKGFSTFALSRAAIVTGAVLVSVDIRDFSRSSHWDAWIFVQMDDLEFAMQFPDWCRERDIEPSIDVLFIDTSHEYEHTKQEIAAFFPLLSINATVIFHDTNNCGWYRRENWTIDHAGDCKRGVIKAVADYFGRPFNEKERFVESIDGWLIKHDPICNGLMIVKRILQDISYGEEY